MTAPRGEPMTASVRRADGCRTALRAEAPQPSKGSPLADDMGATKKRPAQPVLQQATRTTVHREVQPRDAWTSPP